MNQELAEVLADPQAVVIVEWGGVVDDVLPTERAVIHLEATGESSRHLDIHLPPKLAYMKDESN